MELESRKHTDQLKIQEDKLKLASVELKKKLEQTKSDLEAQYLLITRERNRFEATLSVHADIIVTSVEAMTDMVLGEEGDLEPFDTGEIASAIDDLATAASSCPI